MRKAAVGFVMGALLAVALVAMAGPKHPVQAQPPNGAGQRDPLGPAGELIPVSWSADGATFIAIVEPRQRVLSVYQVDGATGALSLKSVRQLHWDLKLEEFNTSTPSPREIRALVERR